MQRQLIFHNLSPSTPNTQTRCCNHSHPTPSIPSNSSTSSFLPSSPSLQSTASSFLPSSPTIIPTNTLQMNYSQSCQISNPMFYQSQQSFNSGTQQMFPTQVSRVINQPVMFNYSLNPYTHPINQATNPNIQPSIQPNTIPSTQYLNQSTHQSALHFNRVSQNVGTSNNHMPTSRTNSRMSVSVQTQTTVPTTPSFDVATWFQSNYFSISQSKSEDQRNKIIESYKERNFPQNILFSEQYKFKPQTVTGKLSGEIANPWFLVYFPYLFAHYSTQYSFEEFLQFWLLHTRPGKDLLRVTLDKLQIDESTNDKISALLRDKFKKNISAVSVGQSWISAGISLGRYKRFKSLLSKHHKSYKKILPPTKSIEKFSGNLRKYLIQKAPYKMKNNVNHITITKSGASQYMNDCVVGWFRRESKIPKELYVKIAFDYRMRVKSAPVLASVSPVGHTEKSPEPNNVNTLSIFTGTETDALKVFNEWPIKECMDVKSATVNEQEVQLKYMMCPDLAAIRKTVKNDETFANDMNEIFTTISKILVLHIFYNHYLDDKKAFRDTRESILFEGLMVSKTMCKQLIPQLAKWREKIIRSNKQFNHPENIINTQEFISHYHMDKRTHSLLCSSINSSYTSISEEGRVICFKCFYTWVHKIFYYVYPDLPIWKWRRTDIHWPNLFDYSLHQCAVCVSHGLNRMLMTNISILVEKDLETMTYFCQMFTKDSPIPELKSPTATYELLDDKYKPYLNVKQWTNNGISVKETKPDAEKDKDATSQTKLEFSQLLFKMCDKIIITIPIWWPHFKDYLDKKELQKKSTSTNVQVDETRQELNDAIIEIEQTNDNNSKSYRINDRLITDTCMKDLWFSFLDVWIVVKSKRSKWIEWKADNYREPMEILSKYKKLVFLNSGRSVGIADYVHIICDHLCEFFDQFGLAPTEYHNIDTEGIHFLQRKRESLTTMNGGCNYDDFTELWIREMKLMVCKLPTSDLEARLKDKDLQVPAQ